MVLALLAWSMLFTRSAFDAGLNDEPFGGMSILPWEQGLTVARQRSADVRFREVRMKHTEFGNVAAGGGSARSVLETRLSEGQYGGTCQGEDSRRNSKVSSRSWNSRRDVTRPSAPVRNTTSLSPS